MKSSEKVNRQNLVEKYQMVCTTIDIISKNIRELEGNLTQKHFGNYGPIGIMDYSKLVQAKCYLTFITGNYLNQAAKDFNLDLKLETISHIFGESYEFWRFNLYTRKHILDLYNDLEELLNVRELIQKHLTKDDLFKMDMMKVNEILSQYSEVHDEEDIDENFKKEDIQNNLNENNKELKKDDEQEDKEDQNPKIVGIVVTDADKNGLIAADINIQTKKENSHVCNKKTCQNCDSIECIYNPKNPNHPEYSYFK